MGNQHSKDKQMFEKRLSEVQKWVEARDQFFDPTIAEVAANFQTQMDDYLQNALSYVIKVPILKVIEFKEPTLTEKELDELFFQVYSKQDVLKLRSQYWHCNNELHKINSKVEQLQKEIDLRHKVLPHEKTVQSFVAFAAKHKVPDADYIVQKVFWGSQIKENTKTSSFWFQGFQTDPHLSRDLRYHILVEVELNRAKFESIVQKNRQSVCLNRFVEWFENQRELIDQDRVVALWYGKQTWCYHREESSEQTTERLENFGFMLKSIFRVQSWQLEFTTGNRILIQFQYQQHAENFSQILQDLKALVDP